MAGIELIINFFFLSHDFADVSYYYYFFFTDIKLANILFSSCDFLHLLQMLNVNKKKKTTWK